MTTVARLLLFLLLIFSTQVWSLGMVQGENYGYDESLNAHIKQGEILRIKNAVYGVFSNFSDITENQFSGFLNARSETGSFFALLSDFNVTKGAGGDLFRVVDDIELADIKKTGAFRTTPG